MTWVKYLVFPFQIILLLHHFKKIPRLLLSDIPSWIHLKLQNLHGPCFLLLEFHTYSTQTLPSQIKNTTRYLSTIVQRKHPYGIKTAFRPLYTTYLVFLYISLLITQSKLITCYNSHSSSGEHIFAAPCPRGTNLKNPPWPRRENLKNPWLHDFTESLPHQLNSLDILPSLRNTTRPPLNLPLTLIKSLVCPKNEHIWIPSHWTYFTQFTRGIPVLYITTTSDQCWHDWSNTIQLFLRPRLINSSTYPLNTTRITMS